MRRAILWVDAHKPLILIPGGLWFYLTVMISVVDPEITFAEVSFVVTLVYGAIAVAVALLWGVTVGWQRAVAWAERPASLERPNAMGDVFLVEAEREVEQLVAPEGNE